MVDSIASSGLETAPDWIRRLAERPRCTPTEELVPLLLNYLVGGDQQRLGNRQPESLGDS
jgi:hypothetical protein